MTEARAFDHVSEELEATTALSQLEARGTVRLALKSAGFEARTITSAQMETVVQRVLPAELVSRGVEDAPAVCERIASSLGAIEDEVTADSPEAVFERLGRSPAASSS